MTKKKIALAALILIVVACVGLIAYRYRPGPQLSKQQKAKIEAACTEIGITHINWEAEDWEAGAVRYYGNIEGYDVFLLFPQTVDLYRGGIMWFGDRELYLPVVGSKLYAYKDGVIHDVEKLYSDNVFNNEVVEEIFERHRMFDDYPFEDIPIYPA